MNTGKYSRGTLIHRCALALLILWSVPLAHAQFWNDYDLEPHDYRGAELDDPVTAFMERVERGETIIDEAPGKDLVTRLLQEFDIPLSSQVIVFTKTSLQANGISSDNPRALYFNEDVYLGWMPEGRIEIASIDSQLGPVFYFQRPLDRPEDLLLRRSRSCLGCHAGSASNFIPGLLSQSTYPLRNGRAMGRVQSFEQVGHDVPYSDRWGGWMVTGSGIESLGHMGNALAERGQHGIEMRRLTAGLQPRDLSVFYQPDILPVEGSDVLAMLVHDHQIKAQYAINEVQYRVRQAFYDAQIGQASAREALDWIEKHDRKAVDKAISKLLQYFTFVNEAPLAGEPVAGHGQYRKDFRESRRISKTGKSLKDLDLKDRLLTYRLSWMIYSRAFQGMPRAAKEEFYHQLYEILSGERFDRTYAHLDVEESKVLMEILDDTLPEWR